MKFTPRNKFYLVQLFGINLLLLFANNSLAQYQQPTFEHISTKDGLSQSTINYILQDRDGFMWIATFNGLNKYDGYSFKIYRKNNNDKNSLSSNDINFLFQDKDGYLWVINGNTGIDRFDPKTETFENFSHDPNDPNSINSNNIRHIMQDSKGNIWICAGNTLNLFVDKELNKNGKARFEKYNYAGSADEITYAYENSDGQLLLFSTHLYYFDRAQKKVINTGVPLANSKVISVIADNNNNLLIGSVFNGIAKLEYNKTAKIYKRVGPGIINVTPHDRTYIYKDHKGHIWIGSVMKGLYCYYPERDFLEHFVQNDLNNSSISDNTIYSLCEDNTGVLWIGTFSQGLNKFDFYRKQFLHFMKIPFNMNSLSDDVVSSMHGLDPKELWVGLDLGGGINRILFSGNEEPKIIRYKFNSEDTNSTNTNSTLCLVLRKNGQLWAGCAGGTVLKIIPEPAFSGKKPVVKKYQFDRWTFAIFEDSDGVLWGGTWDKGLWRYDDKNDRFDFFLPDDKNKYSLCGRVVWSIGEDFHKNIWIGTNGKGISIITADEKKKTSPKFINFSMDKNNVSSLSNNSVNAFCQASDGNFWICTSDGLNKVNNYKDITSNFNNFPNITFVQYHIKDGLPSEGIIGIVEDNDGNIWLSTTFGISKLNPQSGQFVNYNEDHGLQSNEFWHNAYFKNSNGMIFFGGKKGFNAFYPQNILPNSFTPKVVLTELMLFNRIVKVGDTINGQIILRQPINQTKEIELSYKNNILTFQFAALHFAQPSLNKYAYYLQGFEKDWNYAGNVRSATYTNLDPGDYIFKVKATNNDGVWSDKEIGLIVTIKPPWWKTLIVRISAILFLILITILVFRIRLSILTQQKEELQLIIGKRTEELQQVNALLEERQEEILLQNDELVRHRNDLEGLIIERTLELEASKQKAEESDRLKSSFLANMSHEIRTPMNAILGFSDLLGNNDFTFKEKEAFIQTIQLNGESLMVLINDILDISMIESNQLQLHPQNVKLNALLMELEKFYLLKNENNITIECINKIDQEITLFIDPVRFKQIMNNLLSNALKYTHTGFIRFGYEIKGNEIQFFVSDTGIGIEPEHSKFVFNHFYKIELHANKVYRGTGIGLAICKRLVELFNGKIWLKSNPGFGSTFYFTIPITSNSNVLVDDTKKNIVEPIISFENIYFVIAEDEPTNYEVLIRMLRVNEKMHVWCKNGREAVDFIEKLENFQNLIVLMDIKMPVMNGYDSLKMIKRINPKIPVIAVTAYALKNEEKEIMSRGFDGYIAKPIKSNKLKEIINEFINIG